MTEIWRDLKIVSNLVPVPKGKNRKDEDTKDLDLETNVEGEKIVEEDQEVIEVGPEGEDEKQVKVATVRKDVWDLKENFPLHITVGPKVAKSLTYTITICPRSISIKRFRQQNHPFEFLCLYLFNILPYHNKKIILRKVSFAFLADGFALPLPRYWSCPRNQRSVTTQSLIINNN